MLRLGCRLGRRRSPCRWRSVCPAGNGRPARAPGALAVARHLARAPGRMAPPPEQMASFERRDEPRTLRFQVRPALGTAPGEFHVRAVATLNGVDFDRGYQVIEYPHIRRY